jgi:hypothetical protein
MNGSIPLPPVLSAKLTDFRRRVWLVKLTEGILAAVFGLAVSYLLVLGLDRVMETPVWLRTLLLVAGAAVPGIGLPLKWHRWVWRQRRLEDAARLLRWKFPRLGDQLLGIVELAKQDSAVTGRSERLVQAAMSQADEAVKDQNFADAVPQAKHRQWAWAAAGSVALVVTGFVAISDAARNALVRWLMPWKQTERFTFARIAPLPNPLVVPLAEPFELPVDLTADSQWKPEEATASLPGQPEVKAALTGSAYALSFPPLKDDAEMEIKVGDVRQTLRVEPRPRPELTGLKVRQKLPDYLQYKTEPETEVRGGAVSLLTGTKAVFHAAASRDLLQAEINGQAARVEQGGIVSEALSIAGAQDVTFTWKDSLGLTAKVPLVLKVQPLTDEVPRIVARRESLEQVVLESEVVVFDVSATDDFGLKKLGLEWKGIAEGDPKAPVIKGSKVAAAGAPENKSMEVRASFCATREGIAPQSLEIRAWAEDYLEGREASKSATFVIHILNQTDHALWVTQQMGKWLEAARETYEREQQLHATNKELRALSAAELDRPDNRRKVAQQASAENANAERLSALNNAGRQLVEQATKNTEFDAPRLESWATMLKSLQDIAANRMPNVADLLKQSADAKAGSQMAQSGESKPGKPEAEGKPADPSQSQPAGQPGESKPSESTAQNQNQPAQDGKPNEGKAGVPQDSKSAPTIAQGPQAPTAPKPTDPAKPPGEAPEKAPSIKLTESTMNKPEAPDPNAKPEPPKPPGAGKLALPSNSLAAAPGQKKAEGEPPPAETPAQDNLDKGVNSQKELLAEFAKVSDQLTEILASLEASTFVKRLKAASREQTQLASGISQQTLDAFGIIRDLAPPAKPADQKTATLPPANLPGPVRPAVQTGLAKTLEEVVGKAAQAQRPLIAMLPAAEEKAPAPATEQLLPLPAILAKVNDRGVPKEKTPAKKEPVSEAHFVTAFAPEAFKKAKAQSTEVKVIQSDLEAYFQRKPDQHFKKVIAEMKEKKVVQELGRVGERAAENLSGSAVHAAEFWADTMDRWAEEMVEAGKCSNCSSCSGDSLPPEIVLKVMQALRDEMKVRDETRELENAESAMEAAEYASRTGKLAAEQERIGTHTEGALKDILTLPEGGQKFGKEVKLLTAVVDVMSEARAILKSPDTGDAAIAAETEAIELLLQTKRQNPNGGGGGGGDPGGGGRAASASSAALADLGPGNDVQGVVKARPIGQATGRAGREFPEEFKTGLDAYFNNLEQTGTP